MNILEQLIMSIGVILYMKFIKKIKRKIKKIIFKIKQNKIDKKDFIY